MITRELVNLIERLSNPLLHSASVIKWGSPIISFGDLSNSKIATLGINPSNREFVDVKGNELQGDQRRFHTLDSLGITKWSDAKEKHLSLITELCQEYFYRNPYDGWFKRLDYLLSGTSMSYYFPSGQACHLDLIPYATECKWTDLTNEQRSLLLRLTGDTLGLLLKHSIIKVIVLNGQAVVDHFQKITNTEFQKEHMPNWTLSRKSSQGINGYAYCGTVNNIGGIKLITEILVLGYNHNIQSSFGVTSQVLMAIRNWISKKTNEVFE